MDRQHRMTSAAALALIAMLFAAGCSKSKSNSYMPTSAPPAAELAGSLAVGGNFSHTFLTAGTYPYYCTIHGATAMHGSVIVSASASPGDAVVTVSSNSYPSTPTTILVGAKVTWNNTSGAPHTVTSGP